MSLGKKKTLSQGAGFDATENFSPKAYAGGSAGQSVTVGFQPDLIIGKRRDNAEHWWVNDVMRSGKSSFFNLDLAEISFQYTTPTSTGFTVNGTGGVHNTGNLITYCFKGGGSPVTNTDYLYNGKISANPDAGFSVVETTTGTSSASVEVQYGEFKYNHGLTQTPELIFTKITDQAVNWDTFLYPNGTGTSVKSVQVNKNISAYNYTIGTHIVGINSTFVHMWNYPNSNTSPGRNIVTYNFHSVDGYQKIGTYTASNSWGSSISIDVGFAPRLVMVKSLDNAGDWLVVDSLRGGSNGQDRERLFANQNFAAGADNSVDFTGNTFSITFGSTGNQGTANVSQFLYWAVA